MSDGTPGQDAAVLRATARREYDERCVDPNGSLPFLVGASACGRTTSAQGQCATKARGNRAEHTSMSTGVPNTPQALCRRRRARGAHGAAQEELAVHEDACQGTHHVPNAEQGKAAQPMGAKHDVAYREEEVRVVVLQ